MTRKEQPALILVDAGGAFAPPTAEAGNDTSSLVAAMGLMGYDALNVGRDELRHGLEYLQEQQRRAVFPFLSANLVEPGTGRHPFAAYALKPVGQIKVALIGLIAPDLSAGAELEAEAPAAALQRVLSQILGQAQVIVVLAYMPLAEARQLAEQVAGVNVIVVAAEGQVAQLPTVVNGALIVQSGNQGRYVGNLSVTADTLGRFHDYRNGITVLDESYQDDPQINSLLAAP